jgi:hypothetical protein
MDNKIALNKSNLIFKLGALALPRACTRHTRMHALGATPHNACELRLGMRWPSSPYGPVAADTVVS